MNITSTIIGIYSVEIVVGIILFIIVYKRRKKEKETKKIEHKDYKNY